MKKWYSQGSTPILRGHQGKALIMQIQECAMLRLNESRFLAAVLKVLNERTTRVVLESSLS